MEYKNYISLSPFAHYRDCNGYEYKCIACYDKGSKAILERLDVGIRIIVFDIYSLSYNKIAWDNENIYPW